MAPSMRSLILSAFFFLASGAALAQATLEVIPLRHATVDQVLPALQPFLEPGGTLSGYSGQIIVRSSPHNIAELRRILDTVDRPARQLLISVRFDDLSDSSRQGAGVSGTIGSEGSEIDIRAGAARDRGSERVDQQLRVLEGGHAFIATGQSRPMMQRQIIQTPAGPVAQDTFVVQEANSGFDVVPRLSGERVFLDIAPQRERFVDSPVPGAVEGQRIATTVAGRLGEWLEIGGELSDSAREESGLASQARAYGSASRRVWVKVEELP